VKMNQVYNFLLKLWNKIPTNLVEKTKNVLAEVLEDEIKDNHKEIKVLEKENIKIEKEIVQLEEELDVIQDKSEKYKKQYEKEVSDIRNASDDKLVKLFTDTFENYEG
jgi:hypothetical protein